MMAAEVKPLLRGTLHQGAFMVALVVGALFVAYAEGGRRRVAASVFAGSVAAMLGASALYHRITWSPRARPWMRRIDHAGIYLLIAGSYTPVGLLSLHGTLQHVTLAIVWAGAAVAIALKFAWVDAPKWLAAVTGLAPRLGRRRGAARGLGHDRRRRGRPPRGGRARVHGRRDRLRHPAAPTRFRASSVTTRSSMRSTLVAVACQYVAIAFFVVKVA